jgi:hypothetical protein
MSQTMQQNATTNVAPFEPIEHYERLIVLRETSPDTFMLRTSEATRRALHYYERQREMSGAKPEKT